jgi:hypothetical protein
LDPLIKLRIAWSAQIGKAGLIESVGSPAGGVFGAKGLIHRNEHLLEAEFRLLVPFPHIDQTRIMGIVQRTGLYLPGKLVQIDFHAQLAGSIVQADGHPPMAAGNNRLLVGEPRPA